MSMGGIYNLMKAKSAVQPAWYWLDRIKKKEGRLALILRIRWNVHQVIVEDMDKQSHTEYEYDEQIIAHVLAQKIAKDEVISYIETHQDELLTEAQAIAGEAAIADEDINEVRKQPVKPGFIAKPSIDTRIGDIEKQVRKRELDLESPNGSKWKLKIDDTGIVTTEKKLSESTKKLL